MEREGGGRGAGGQGGRGGGDVCGTCMISPEVMLVAPTCVGVKGWKVDGGRGRGLEVKEEGEHKPQQLEGAGVNRWRGDGVEGGGKGWRGYISLNKRGPDTGTGVNRWRGEPVEGGGEGWRGGGGSVRGPVLPMASERWVRITGHGRSPH